MQLTEALSDLPSVILSALLLISRHSFRFLFMVIRQIYFFIIYTILDFPRPIKTTQVEEKEVVEEQKEDEEHEFEPQVKKRRGYAADELIRSEYTFSKNLKLLYNTFRPGLKECLTPEDLSLFFDDLPILIKASDKNIRDFEAQINRGIDKAEFGPCFFEDKHLVDPFIPYISHYLKLLMRYNELITDDKVFKKTIKKLEFDTEPFTSLIITPVQRMPKYHLLIKEILKGTPDWHPDFKYLKQAAVIMENEAKKADNECNEANRRLDLLVLQRTIKQCPNLMNNDKRCVIGKWKLAEERMELYLLSDMILIVKQKTETLTRKEYKILKRMIDLMRIIEIQQINNGIRLKMENEEYDLVMKIKIEQACQFIQNQLTVILTERMIL